MVILLKVKYPFQSAKQMATKFLEAPPIPEFMVMKGPYFTGSTQDGMHATAILELNDKSKFLDGIDFIGKFMAIFYEVPGFCCEYRQASEIDDAMKILGM